MEQDKKVIRMGVIGCGGFGLFALQHFTQVENVQLIGMAGTHRPAAYACARRFGIPDIQDVDIMLSRDDIDLVYIATPPFLHYPQAIKALQTKKHVIVEKPLALVLEQVDEMIALARKNRLLLAVDLMQRYNLLFDVVKCLIDEKPLGELLHGYFENYATDEGLTPDHWFWDKSKSGGIFIEHGVHFFDLFEGWLGAGKVVSAQKVLRADGVEEQVQCTVRYGDVLINFYHGFHQPARMDRQELRLVFERGDVTLYEWVPTYAVVKAIADEADTKKLCELFKGGRLDVTELYSGQHRFCRGRHKDLNVYQKLQLHWGEGGHKMHRYGELLRAFFQDQIAWIFNPNHQRKVTEQNGRNSLEMAISADNLAQQS